MASNCVAHFLDRDPAEGFAKVLREYGVTAAVVEGAYEPALSAPTWQVCVPDAQVERAAPLKEALLRRPIRFVRDF